MFAIWPSRLPIKALSSLEDIGRFGISALVGDAAVVRVDGVVGSNEDSGLEVGLLLGFPVICPARTSEKEIFDEKVQLTQ